MSLRSHIVKKYYALPGDQDDLISIGTMIIIISSACVNLAYKLKVFVYRAVIVKVAFIVNIA